uniref:THAP-type domain-containing protein n=1 Tax=Oryzias latipes TaxID=8090 RepID=A0A3P9H3G2_ORYLA
MPSRCVAAGCSNISSESVSVYKFPKQETLLKQWTKQVQRTRANWVPTASSTLCSEHFEADYMGMHVRYKKVLKPNAIPTIFKRSLVGTYETETPSTSTGISQYKKKKSVTEKLAQKRVSLTGDPLHTATMGGGPLPSKPPPPPPKAHRRLSPPPPHPIMRLYEEGGKLGTAGRLSPGGQTAVPPPPARGPGPPSPGLGGPGWCLCYSDSSL